MRLLFFNLQKGSLACRECATLQTRYPLWSASPPIRHLSTHRAALWVRALVTFTSTQLLYVILVMVNVKYVTYKMHNIAIDYDLFTSLHYDYLS